MYIDGLRPKDRFPDLRKEHHSIFNSHAGNILEAIFSFYQWSRCAMFVDESSESQELAAAIRRRFNQAGIEIAFFRTVSTGTTEDQIEDMYTEIKKNARSKKDTILNNNGINVCHIKISPTLDWSTASEEGQIKKKVGPEKKKLDHKKKKSSRFFCILCKFLFRKCVPL